MCKEKQQVYKRMRQEFMDFWDVFREFNDLFTPEMKNDYLILQMI